MTGMRWLLAAALIGAAMPAQAQVFVDVFAGRSLPQSGGATIRAEEVRIDGSVVPADLRIDVDSLSPTDSTIFGARIGHWWNAFGVAIDAATLDPDVAAQTIRATGTVRFDETLFGERVTIDPGTSVSVTIPRVTVPTTATVSALAMLRLPGGVVEPYVFAGPTYLFTESNLSGDWGVRAGSFSGSAMGVTGDTGTIFVDTRIRNHSVAGGVRLSF